MARKKKKELLQKILLIGGSLVIVQVGFIVYHMQETESRPIREEIAEKVRTYPGISDQRREQLKIQLSLSDYKEKNGKYPDSLNALIPDYFEIVPVDASTGKPFAYKLEGGKPVVGERTQVASASAPGAKPGESGTPGQQSEQEQEALIASLDKGAETVAFVYDPTGKRDPFRPYDQAAASNVDCAEFPLACYDIGQLRLTAVLGDGDSATATVEDTTGKGFIVKKGTRIGRFGGEVVEIHANHLKILETITDFTGNAQNRVVEMGLRTKDLEQNARQPARRR